MPAQDVERQYLPAMKLMWDEVDRLFEPVRILTPAGHHFAQTYAARAAHAEFPYAVHLLSLMCPLSNGARVAVFPTSPSPLVAFCVNVNYAQTRKSSMTAHADAITRDLDLSVHKQVAQLVLEEHQEICAASDANNIEGVFILLAFLLLPLLVPISAPLPLPAQPRRSGSTGVLGTTSKSSMRPSFLVGLGSGVADTGLECLGIWMRLMTSSPPSV